MLNRLSKYTYFSKINLNSNLSNDNVFKNMALPDLYNLASVNNNVKANCIAKIFNYFTTNNPLFTYINVYCKLCNYQNSLPYHFVNVCEPTISSKLFLIENYENYLFNPSPNNETKSYLYKQDFNVDWLIETKPSEIVTILDETTKERKTSFYYDCPRCFWLNKKSHKLNYVYRFAFRLIDNNFFKLGPCILEGDIALKYIDNIDPLEFCHFSNKAISVCNMLLNMFNKEAYFELESYNHGNNEIFSVIEKNVFKIKNINFSK